MCHQNAVTLTPGDQSSCICDKGYAYSDEQCVECLPGSYKNSVSNSELCQPCPADTYEDSTAASSCRTCSSSSSTYGETGRQVVDACLCTAGFQRLQDACVLCSANSYCPGEDLVTACPAGATSLQGSDVAADCECAAGFYYTELAGPSCEVCPENHYCVSGTTQPAQCQEQSSAPAGSTSESACVCDAGYEAI